MFVFSNVIKPQGLEPLQFPTKFRSHSFLRVEGWSERECADTDQGGGKGDDADVHGG